MLNKQQLEAVKHKKGPLLIIAGAGTGKTTVITERIKFLIENALAEPEEILALTFTEKASKEMQERVDLALPLGYSQMWISTFHSFCDRLLRDEALEIGLDSHYELLTQARAMKLIRDNLFELDLDYYRPLGNPTKFIYGLLVHFSRLQDEDISPDKYLAWARSRVKHGMTESDELENKKYLELANAYQKYDQIKIEKSVLDFGDLIAKSIMLFEKRPNILSKYRQKFKYILVDEFQDTNFSQNKLAMMLAGKNGNFTAVGDDDQSIYRFRGAAISNIMQFRETYPKAKTVVLNQNYRSGQAILDASYELITHNNPDRLEVKEGVNKKLVANRKIKSEITFIHTKNDSEEAEKIAEEILSLQKSHKYEFSDFAILVRANNHSEVFINTFKRLGIPHQFLGPARLFEQEEIIDLISFFRVLTDFNDNYSLARLLTIKELGFSQKNITKFLAQAKKTNKSLFEVLEESEEEIIKKLNNYLEKAQTELAGVLLYEFLQEFGMLTSLLNPDTEEVMHKANNIAQFFDRLKTLEKTGNGNVAGALEWIDLVTELGESPIVQDGDWSEENKVNILTVHSAKGLEFPVVFLPNLVSLRFPSMNRRDQVPIPDDLIKDRLPSGDFHLEEERRLFYVGMTRARDKLFLTAADYYDAGKTAKKLSPFIFEALGEDTVSLEAKPNINSKNINYSEEKKKTKPSPRKDLHIHYLSYSQIEAFNVCPLHYKLRYILKIPTPASNALSLGTSVHDTMNEVYIAARNKQKINNKLVREILKNNWINSGFLSKKHSEESFKQALNYIANYFEKNFDKNNLPVLLEEPFVVSLPTEEDKKPLKIGGKIDRVDDLGGGVIEIIDYKTGSNVPSQRDADKNLQLSIYALAASQLNLPIFKNAKKIKLSLYYFEEDKKITTARSARDLKNAIQEIYEVRDEIENSDFACSNHYFCQNGCEFEMFCKGQ